MSLYDITWYIDVALIITLNCNHAIYYMEVALHNCVKMHSKLEDKLYIRAVAST